MPRRPWRTFLALLEAQQERKVQKQYGRKRPYLFVGAPPKTLPNTKA